MRHPPTGARLVHWPLALVPGGPITPLILAAVAVVVPLGLAVRYPLLAWRMGWLGLLLVPLLGASWWGGLPWDPVQILVLLVVLCAAGTRHNRAVLGWLWALTLVPWWLGRQERPERGHSPRSAPRRSWPWRSRWTARAPGGGPR